MKVSRHRAIAAIVAGPLIFFALTFVPPPGGMSVEAWRLLALLAWMVAWWLSEVVPLAATALLPIVVMPLAGIAEIRSVTQAYGHPLIFLFLGGLMLAMAIQGAGLHRRIALVIISRVGTSPRRLTLGFMVATAFLSMWITNTAATIMMYAVALSVIDFMERQAKAADDARRFAVGLMLAVAYSASIGGMGTLIGSPPNALLASTLAGEYGIRIDFYDWMLIGMPVAVVMLAGAWVLLTFVLYPPRASGPSNLKDVIQSELAALGTMGRSERVVSAVFAFAAIGWIFGDPIVDVTGLPITDTTVALTAALLLFAIPIDRSAGRFALDWATAKELPWNVLLLIGGGLAIATAFQVTGLADWIGGRVGDLDLSVLAIVLLVTTIMVFLTEVMSNPASAATLLPVVAAVAVGLDRNPMLLAVAATIAASMAFMMPVATAPNAIVFSYKDLKMADMMRAGVLLNVIGIAVCTLAVYFVFRPIHQW